MRRSKTLFAVASLILLIACTRESPPAVAAKVIAAPSGPSGWIEGRVTARGKLPALKPQPLDSILHPHCGTSAPDRSLVVAADGALQFAVVSVDGAAPSPVPPSFSLPLVDQQACLFRPPVVATRAGEPIRVRNSDPLLHNVRAMDGRKLLFNVSMPQQHLTVDRPLPAVPGIVKLHCDVHPWMTAWVVTFDHSLYAATDAEGKFRIDGVPAGRHTLELWHPRLGEQRSEVEVQADAGTTLELGWEVSDTPAR